MGPDYTRRYTAKVAELRKTDLRIDWSEVFMRTCFCVGVGAPQQTHFLPEPSGFATSKAKLALRATNGRLFRHQHTDFLEKSEKSAKALSERLWSCGICSWRGPIHLTVGVRVLRRQLLQQRLRFLQIARVEPLREPPVYRS